MKGFIWQKKKKKKKKKKRERAREGLHLAVRQTADASGATMDSHCTDKKKKNKSGISPRVSAAKFPSFNGPHPIP